MSKTLMPLHLSRYKGGHSSALTLMKKSTSSIITTKFSYHSAKIATLEPITEAKSAPVSARNDDEPLVDDGLSAALTTIPLYHNKYHKDVVIPQLSPLPANFTKDSTELLNKKLNNCCIMCDFSDPEADLGAKSVKTATLKELVNVFGSPVFLPVVTDESKDLFFTMITTNLGRDIPFIPKKYLFSNDEPLIYDIAWPHLNLVYSLLLKYQGIIPNDRHFDDPFVLFMINLLQAPDPNERDQVFQFFQAYLTAFPKNEVLVLKESSYLVDLYHDTNEPFGVSSYLKLFTHTLGQNTNDAFKYDLFKISIIPLIGSNHFISFYPLLTKIFDKMIAAHPETTVLLVQSLLAHWPEAKPSKELYAIQLLDFLVAHLSQEEFTQMCPVIFKRYAICGESLHGKVVETSFKVWSNVKIIPQIVDNTKIIFPIIYPVIQRTTNQHWSRSIQDKALGTLRTVHDLDPLIAESISQQRKNSVQTETEEQTVHKSWAIIARQAAKFDRDLNLARTLAEMQKKFNTPQNIKLGSKNSQTKNSFYASSAVTMRPK